MHNSKNIHVALATSEPEKANRLLQNIKKALPSYEVEALVLLFGMKAEEELYDFCTSVEIIDFLQYYPAIVDSRNICQLKLHHKMNETGGIGFVLDDDLEWTVTEKEFITLVDQLKIKKCDMAFSALSGDSPIPKEYTRTSPLLDVLFAIHDNGADSDIEPIHEYIKKAAITESRCKDVYAHHDFYSFKPKQFKRFEVDIENINWSGFIERLAKGKATTRNIQLPTMITKASGRERGGATIIFNPDVLLCKNEAIRFLDLISRRSDMIMAIDAVSYNFKLFNTPPIFEHRREETFDSHDSKKLIGDILGYALVESKKSGMYCQKKFLNKLTDRVEQTKLLLNESSNMMRLLGEWLIQQNLIELAQHNLLISMVAENDKALIAINDIDIKLAVNAFNLYIRNRAKVNQI